MTNNFQSSDEIIKQASTVAEDTAKSAKRHMEDILAKSQKDLARSIASNKLFGSYFADKNQTNEVPEDQDKKEHTFYHQVEGELAALEVLPGVTWKEYSKEVGGITEQFQNESHKPKNSSYPYPLNQRA